MTDHMKNCFTALTLIGALVALTDTADASPAADAVPRQVVPGSGRCVFDFLLIGIGGSQAPAEALVEIKTHDATGMEDWNPVAVFPMAATFYTIPGIGYTIYIGHTGSYEFVLGSGSYRVIFRNPNNQSYYCHLFIIP